MVDDKISQRENKRASFNLCRASRYAGEEGEVE